MEVRIKDDQNRGWKFNEVERNLFSFHPQGGDKVQTGYRDEDFVEVDEGKAHLYGNDGIIVLGSYYRRELHRGGATP